MTKLEYAFMNDTPFKARTEEDLAKIEALEVTVMQEAIGAYRQVSSTGEFREIERLRSLARHNEASALHHARSMGIAEGEARGQIKSVITVLEIRFGEISATLRKALLDIRACC